MDDLGGRETWEDSGPTSHPKQGQVWDHTRRHTDAQWISPSFKDEKH